MNMNFLKSFSAESNFVRLKKNILCLSVCVFFGNSVFATNYFVNDASTVGDVYSTAAGNNGNNGLSAATPKATFTNLLSTYSGVLTSGDVIKIDAGTYSDANITINIVGISIVGAGPAKTVFDNAYASVDANRLFTITANNITISGIYVKGYNRGTGGASAIQITGASGVVFNNVLTDENRPGGGSATLVVDGGSSVTFNGGGSNCNSTGSVAGGGVNIEGNGNNVTFNNYSFSNNSKSYQGGSGLYIVGNSTTNVTLSNCIVADNRNTSDGGAIYISGSNLTVTGTCFSNNTTSAGTGPKYGGAVTVGRGATVSFTNCSFTSNAVSNSGRGGAISINTSLAGTGTTATVNVTTCSFSGNTSNASGHHLYAREGFSNVAIFNINNCTFSASGQDIMNGNSATINLQNSGNPSTSGTINTLNTTAPSSTAVTSCPVLQGACYGIILPIELIDFAGSCEKTHVILEWSTASEHNNDFFTIEHAGSNGLSQELKIIKGQINTTQKTDYSYADYYSEPGINYYRLSQTDVDGTARILKTIAVKNDCLSGNNLNISVSYNSQNNSINLGYLVKRNEVLVASVYNTMGQLVQTAEIELKASDRKSEIELTSYFTSGIYFLQLANETILFSDKFLINK